MPTPPDQPAPHDVVTVAHWLAMPSATVFDTRTPAEFAQGHIPGAINLPLFDNDERAEIEVAMARYGIRSMSDFLRFAALFVARRRAPENAD